MELAASLGVDLARRDVGRLERRELRRQAATRVARRRREQRDEPRRVGPREVGAVELARHRVDVARRRLGRSAPEEPRNERRRRRGSPRRSRGARPSAPQIGAGYARSGTAAHRSTHPRRPSSVSPTTTGRGRGDDATVCPPPTRGARARRSPSGRRRSRRLGALGGSSAVGVEREQLGGDRVGAGVEHGHDPVGVDARAAATTQRRAARGDPRRARHRRCSTTRPATTRASRRRRAASCPRRVRAYARDRVVRSRRAPASLTSTATTPRAGHRHRLRRRASGRRRARPRPRRSTRSTRSWRHRRAHRRCRRRWSCRTGSDQLDGGQLAPSDTAMPWRAGPPSGRGAVEDLRLARRRPDRSARVHLRSPTRCWRGTMSWTGMRDPRAARHDDAPAARRAPAPRSSVTNETSTMASSPNGLNSTRNCCAPSHRRAGREVPVGRPAAVRRAPTRDVVARARARARPPPDRRRPPRPHPARGSRARRRPATRVSSSRLEPRAVRDAGDGVTAGHAP